MILHAESPISRGFGDYAISPMYLVIDEHGIALILAALVPLGFWAASRWAARRDGLTRRLFAGYRRRPAGHKLAAWMVGFSATIHLGLALGHETSAWNAAYLAGAVGMGFALVHIVEPRRRSRALVTTILVGSVLAYVGTGLAGHAPDQLGLATKLAEITALIALADPAALGRLRRGAATAGRFGLVVLVSLSAWIGALQSGSGGHHAGETPAPGVALPIGEERAPTTDEMRAADMLYAEAVEALAKYHDPEVAAADGYRVDGLHGSDFHADNPTHLEDGLLLDPTRPETLVYAESPGGPILLGAMFQMPDIGEAGPAVGGPLTVWHAHDHVCFSLLPPTIGGLMDPFGLCPVGSITIPITNEMIHLWVLPGLDDPFGDIDDEWLEGYLAAQG